MFLLRKCIPIRVAYSIFGKLNAPKKKQLTCREVLLWHYGKCPSFVNFGGRKTLVNCEGVKATKRSRKTLNFFAYHLLVKCLGIRGERQYYSMFQKNRNILHTVHRREFSDYLFVLFIY
jgi:hypothetical protein